MSEDAEGETFSPVGRRAQKLGIASLTLGLLPFPLVVPLYFSYFAWINSWIQSHRQPDCAAFGCPAQKFWDSLGWAYVLGPEIIIAGVAIICALIGLSRVRQHLISQKDGWWFEAGLTSGILCVSLFGGLLIFGIIVFAGTTL
jgi:hypothetical protein